MKKVRTNFFIKKMFESRTNTKNVNENNDMNRKMGRGGG